MDDTIPLLGQTLGSLIVQQWESAQQAGKYTSYKKSMEGLAKLIDDQLPKRTVNVVQKIVSEPISREPPRDDYRERQLALRRAGFNAYNCDEIDEFPKW